MKVEIDRYSGFCFGVVYAIQKAEEVLEEDGSLYCLGDIVHNGKEVERLANKGLKTITHEEFANLKDCKVLLRAHGEPPKTYLTAMENNINLVDASCPVVLQLQHRVKEGYYHMEDENGQVVIYGKKGHAEVNGLVGQTKGKAIVVESEKDLCLVDFSRPVNLFSQTTKSTLGFKQISETIRARMIEAQGNDDWFFYNDTLCRQVSNRDKKLRRFAEKYDVIVFVAGRKSSNGRSLFSVCKDVNDRSYFVSDVDELYADWFEDIGSVGICGATSTPRWLMEAVQQKILDLAAITE